MAVVTKSLVKVVAVKDLKPGDRLLVDIIGYKDRVIYQLGKVLNGRDISWLREKLKEAKPRIPSEKYKTGKRAQGPIRTKDGTVLVKTNGEITEEALTPLLKEGFERTEELEGGVIMFTRKQDWPDDRPWRIDQFNPAIKVETMVTVNDEVQETPSEGPAPKPATTAAGQQGDQPGRQGRR